MYLHECLDKEILVYELKENIEKVEEFKKEELNNLINKYNVENTFYIYKNTSVNYNNLSEWEVLNNNSYTKMYDIKEISSLKPFKTYNKEMIKKLEEEYKNGIINEELLTIGNQHFITGPILKNVSSFYYSNAIKVSKQMAFLWCLEHNDLNFTMYKKILELFSFECVKEYNKKDLEDLIDYGLLKKDDDSKKIKEIKKIKGL